MRSILLFRLGGLGDLLVALPSIRLFKNLFGEASLSLVCRDEYGRLLEKTGVVDAVFPAEDRRWLAFFDDKPAAQVPEDLKTWLSGFDVILGWFQQKRSLTFFRKIRSLTRADVRIVAYDPSSGMPISRYFFDQTAALMAGPNPPNLIFKEACRLPLPIVEGLDQSSFRGRGTPARADKLAVVHPGSGSEKKCWPLENFLDVIRFFHQRGIKGFLVTGEAEERTEWTIQGSGLPPGWSWLRRPPLLKLTGLLREAEVYLGNDSGVTHLAAACGTPGLALFRRDLETAWKPYGRIDVLSESDITAIPIESVLEKIRLSMI